MPPPVQPLCHATSILADAPFTRVPGASVHDAPPFVLNATAWNQLAAVESQSWNSAITTFGLSGWNLTSFDPRLPVPGNALTNDAPPSVLRQIPVVVAARSVAPSGEIERRLT